MWEGAGITPAEANITEKAFVAEFNGTLPLLPLVRN